jgi:AcrR family transcriptional regulator
MATRTKASGPPAVNFRQRVGRERRERTRARILQSSFRVFAEKGHEQTAIDDVIKAADVARGTFYNHFETIDDLLVATSKWLEDELILSIESEIGKLKDPVERLATGLRLWLRAASENEVFCAFIVRNRYRGELVEQQIARDVGKAIRKGQFAVRNADAGRDLIIGSAREALTRMMAGPAGKGYVDEVARAILRGLGVDARSIERLVTLELPAIRGLPAPAP